MSGGGHGSEHNFTGWQKHFNSYTMRGRLNCAYASLGFWASVFLAIKFWPSKSKELTQTSHGAPK